MESVPEIIRRLLESQKLKSTQFYNEILRVGELQDFSGLSPETFRDHWFDKFSPTKIHPDELIVVLTALNNLQIYSMTDAFNIISQLSLSKSKSQLKVVFEGIAHLFNMEVSKLQSLYDNHLDKRDSENQTTKNLLMRLPSATYTKLWGIEGSDSGECDDEVEHQSNTTSTKILYHIVNNIGTWIINVEGIGGIGKTATVHHVVNRLAKEYGSLFTKICWVRIDSLDPSRGMHISANEMEQRIERVINSLCDQVNLSEAIRLPISRKVTKLQEFFKTEPCIVVVDNLQSPLDLEALALYIQPLVNPTWFILTCRGTLLNNSLIEFQPFHIKPLNCNDTIRMVRYEASLPNQEIARISDATISDLQAIYSLTQGHPQAIKIIIGQMRLVDPLTALKNLEDGVGLDIKQMYLNIYRKAYEMLSPNAKRILRKFGVGSSDEGIYASTLVDIFEESELTEGLQELYQHKLIMVDTLNLDHLYSVHQITRNFLRVVVQKMAEEGEFAL